MFATGDTIAAGADTAVYISTNAGVSFARSSKPVAGVGAITAVFFRNGRLFAGTFGQGVFISDNRGTTWQAFSQGLVGGPLNSQLDVVGLLVRSDIMYAATAGAGAYARGLVGATTWQHFGDVFEPNQASNMNSIALGGTRLIATGGANGMVFTNDPGQTDWTISNLDNIGIHAGLSAFTGIWNGFGWVIGSNLGLFHSVAGQEPWTRVDPGFGALDWATFAARGRHLFLAFDVAPGAVIEESDDDGATWGSIVGFGGVFIHDLAVSGTRCSPRAVMGCGEARSRCSPVPGDARATSVHFALAGPQPFQSRTRVRFELTHAGRATIQMYDVLGRATGERIDASWSAGPHEVELDGHRLSPGVYTALLTAGDAREAVRLVHVR
jgi:hypothetical protein